MDAYDAWVVYKLLDSDVLRNEIAEVHDLIMQSYLKQGIDQDLGLGMMLWLAHFFPDEDWARLQLARSVLALEELWVEPPGYFCRQRGWRNVKFAFTNYGISLGLQATGHWPDKVNMLNTFFDQYRSKDEYDHNAITHVMACTSHFPGKFLATDGTAGRS